MLGVRGLAWPVLHDHVFETSEEIVVETPVIYAEAAGEASLDTDVTLDAGSGKPQRDMSCWVASSDKGVVTFSGGTGALAGFQANADVTPDAEGNSHWDGSYSFD